jgi:copper chaperone CopZ
MKSSARLFLISLIAYITLIICSCGEAPVVKEPLKLSGQQKTVTFTVTNITCQPCTVRIQSALLNTPGVESAKATLEKTDNVVVSYFSDHITNLQIQKVLEDMGYIISVVKDE